MILSAKIKKIVIRNFKVSQKRMHACIFSNAGLGGNPLPAGIKLLRDAIDPEPAGCHDSILLKIMPDPIRLDIRLQLS